MPPLLIVDKLLLLAQLRGAGLQMQQPASSVDAVQDIVGYLSLALGLLSMQRDRSDALSASVVEGKERYEVNGDREIEIEGAGRAHDPDLAVADTQLKSLWAIALRVQESLWLDIVVSSSLKNAQGEDGRDGDALYFASDGLMSTSVFGLLMAECKASAREGLLRKDMIPSVPGPDEKEDEEGGFGGRGDGETLENNQRSRLSLKSLLSSLDFMNSPDWQRMQHLVLGSDTAQLQSLHR
jgi:hypothetical protein